ncbi:hypothetical protein [Glaciihabitans sp. dw_435]|uniref:hypothetical protein n=1 Tax=Glaciihabitans sp. dw_435 TaxID=2720081 RepID=UPI001BD2AABA|nr:hypothetical protein [Glaciihabitans sp. dw_435]
MSHTFKSRIDGKTITVDESIEQLSNPGDWEEVVKQTAAEKKAEKEAAEKQAAIDAQAKIDADAKEAAEKTAAEQSEAERVALEAKNTTPSK